MQLIRISNELGGTPTIIIGDKYLHIEWVACSEVETNLHRIN